jgi:hypothetical protein
MKFVKERRMVSAETRRSVATVELRTSICKVLKSVKVISSETQWSRDISFELSSDFPSALQQFNVLKSIRQLPDELQSLEPLNRELLNPERGFSAAVETTG